MQEKRKWHYVSKQVDLYEQLQIVYINMNKSVYVY